MKPFSGKKAIAAGDVTRGQLRGPSFRKLGRDCFVDTSADDTLALRAVAASVGIPGAVIGGYAAAELLGASCGPVDAAVDAVVGRRRVRPAPGLVVHQDVLEPAEIVVVDGVVVTSAPRTAYDLARRLVRDEAVVALDALAHHARFDVTDLLTYPAPRDNPRGTAAIPEVVAAADARAQSPPETRLRLLVASTGLPAPEPQAPVLDVAGTEIGRVDLGWTRWRIGLEYQGEYHYLTLQQRAADARRFARMAAAGWLIIPVTAPDMRGPSRLIVDRVCEALAERGAIVLL